MILRAGNNLQFICQHGHRCFRFSTVNGNTHDLSSTGWVTVDTAKRKLTVVWVAITDSYETDSWHLSTQKYTLNLNFKIHLEKTDFKVSVFGNEINLSFATLNFQINFRNTRIEIK